MTAVKGGIFAALLLVVCAARPGAHDPSLLIGSIEARVRGTALELEAIGVGHAFPTGDLFRHVVVEVRHDRWIEVERIGRTFDAPLEGEAHVKQMVRDTRLVPGEARRIDLRKGDRWRVVYRYTKKEQPMVVLAEGIIGS